MRTELVRTGLVIAIAAVSVPTRAVQVGQVQTPRSGFGPGRCGPVDPAYTELAARTGGQVFILGQSDSASSAEIATAAVANSPLLLSASGQAPTSLTLPVDKSTRRLIVTSMFDKTGGTLALVGPDGAEAAANERTVDAQLNCGRIVTLDRPDAGVWHASLSPTGQFWLNVKAESDLDLIAEFVQAGPDGPSKITGEPVAGRPATLRATVIGPEMRSYEFVLLSAAGQPIQKVTLAQDVHGIFGGTIDVPSEPFRVAVTGVDASGAAYQRSSKLPFHGALVEVLPDALDTSLPPGSEKRVAFTIRNAGPAARYRIVAIDDQRLVSRVEPAVLDLEAGAEQRITIGLTVPPGTAAGTETDLIVIASSEGSRPTSNRAVMHVRVGAGDRDDRIR